GLELARDYVDLHEQREAVPWRQRHADVPRVAWNARELLARFEVLGVEIRIVGIEADPGNGIERGVGFDALDARLSHVLGLEEERRRIEDELDEIGEVLVEKGRAEPDAVLQESLIGAHLPARAVLRLETGIAEPWQEQIVDGRRPEPLPPGKAELAPDLSDEERAGGPTRERAAEHVVVFPAEPAPEEDAVEDGQLVLPEQRQRVERLGEGARERSLGHVRSGLASVLPPER